jgi:hypothetical protein
MISWAATLSSTKPVPPVRVAAVVQAGAGVAAPAVVEAVVVDEEAVAVDEEAVAEAGTGVIVAAVAVAAAATVAGNHLQR